MTAVLYPGDLDAFRQYLADSTDYLVAQDLNDFLTVAVALETELGIKPSGTQGTVSARLFGTNNLGTSGQWSNGAGWRPLKWSANHSVNPTHNFDRSSGLGVSVAIQPTQFAGRETIYGENIPAAWGALQFPIQTPATMHTWFGAGLNTRGGMPWRAVRIRSHRDDLVSWVAIDGQSEEINVGYYPVMACGWGYIIWNLKT